MPKSPVVIFVKNEAVRLSQLKNNTLGDKIHGENGCVEGPYCPKCQYSRGSVYGCMAPSVYCYKQTNTPCPGGW